MNRIAILQPYLANQIAAGEVVERPASVIKELVENAIDANAVAITVEIKNGGIDYMRVTDNGTGIQAEDCMIAFERHATSKISQQEDLEGIETLGFRGEALSSIAAVAQVGLRTCAIGEDAGTHIRIEGGTCLLHERAGCPTGTSIEVENLFYNVPARRKFLKSARTESAYVGEYVTRMIQSRPDIAFRYINNGKAVYQSQGDGSLKQAVYCVYGAEVLPHIKEVLFDNGYVQIKGFIGTAEIARPNRKDQVFVLNGRIIRSSTLSNALQRAYDTRLMGGRYPFAVVHIKLSSREVDVNVHPAKLEVRFAQENRVYAAMMDACERALRGRYTPEASLSAPVTPAPPERALTMREAHVNSFSSASSQPPTARTEARQQAEPRELEPFPPFQLSEEETVTLKEAFGKIPHFRVLQAIRATPEAPPANDPNADAMQLSYTSPIAIIGQVFSSYWIAQQDETVYFIDQHAAHERKLYEQFMAREQNATSQPLLEGEVLQLTPSEQDTLLRYQPLLQELGYEIDSFGPTSIRVTAIPGVFAGMPVGRFFRDALEILTRQGKTTTKEIQKEAIIQSACKHAVKAGDPLSREEIADLIEYFHKQGLPMTCPHGRPVMVRLSLREIEKLFKRIV